MRETLIILAATLLVVTIVASFYGATLDVGIFLLIIGLLYALKLFIESYVISPQISRDRQSHDNVHREYYDGIKGVLCTLGFVPIMDARLAPPDLRKRMDGFFELPNIVTMRPEYFLVGTYGNTETIVGPGWKWVNAGASLTLGFVGPKQWTHLRTEIPCHLYLHSFIGRIPELLIVPRRVVEGSLRLGILDMPIGDGLSFVNCPSSPEFAARYWVKAKDKNAAGKLLQPPLLEHLKSLAVAKEQGATLGHICIYVSSASPWVQIFEIEPAISGSPERLHDSLEIASRTSQLLAEASVV